MANANPSSFVGNVEQKIFRKMKINDFYSILHSTTVAANSFETLEILPGIYLEHEIESSP